MNTSSPNTIGLLTIFSGDFDAYYGLAPLFSTGCSYSS
jgi:hypothetical protein